MCSVIVSVSQPQPEPFTKCASSIPHPNNGTPGAGALILLVFLGETGVAGCAAMLSDPSKILDENVRCTFESRSKCRDFLEPIYLDPGWVIRSWPLETECRVQ